MKQTASREKPIAAEDRMFVAFELGWKDWKVGFGSGMGEKPCVVTIRSRDLVGLGEALGKARMRLGMAAGCRVFSCYEAGREGFWLHRQLTGMGIENVVVDSSSIEVNRRARRAKTDRLDARKLLGMLVRYWGGEKDVWSVVKVPTSEQEDGRHLQREIRTLTKEQTRLTNRIKGLLASQGVAARMGRRGLEEGLDAIRIWDGSRRLDSGSVIEGERSRPHPAEPLEGGPKAQIPRYRVATYRVNQSRLRRICSRWSMGS